VVNDQGLTSDDMTVTSSASLADNADNVAGEDDALISSDVTDTDAAAAADMADDHCDDVIARNLQKRQ